LPDDPFRTQIKMLSDRTIEHGTAVFVLSRSSQPFGPNWVATLASDTSISISEIISTLLEKDIGAIILNV
jgi:hypothetical protein